MRNRCAIVSIGGAVLAMVLCAVAAAAPVRTSQSGWTWGNPRPQGHELRAIDFAGGRGYAVGDFGTVLRTDDGGTSWSGVRTGLVDDLSKLRVIDANTFVAGGGCTLLRSDDGGMTLRRLRFNPSTNCGSPLAAMHFATKDVGYLVRGDGSVLRTVDGGAQYASRTALPGTGGGPPNDAWFTSPDNGVVVTGSDTLGKVFRTTNGGDSWTEVATSAALRGLFFVSETTGYAVGQSAVLKTTNGGANWTPLDVSVPAPLRSVRCGDENHCVVIAGNGVVNHTDDGFETLEPSGYEPPPGGAVPLLPIPGLAASFNSATRVAVVGRRGDDATSDNAGRTFTPIGSELQGSYTRLRLTSQSTVFAPGTGGSVARSTDTGATWSRVGAPTTNDIVDLAFPTATLGYAVDTEGAVFRTDNSGTSWAILGDAGARPNSITTSGDGNVVMLIGPRGVQRSTNGGKNFDPVEASAVGPRVALDDVDRTDGGTYVYGPKAIAFTANEGAKWSVVRRPSRSSILDADFVDRKTGYVLTGDRRVWVTTNRGGKWRELLTVGGDSPYAIAFGDRSNGYLAVTGWAGNGNGWVLHTSDGGASWRPQLLSTASAANRFAMVATGADIAHTLVGSSDMFSTASGGDAATSSTLTLSTKTKRLRRRGKVRVDGKLSPAAAGAEVEVAVRELGSNRWTRQVVVVRSDGTFATNWTVRRSSSFVARWAGSQELNGDGSPALRVTVGR